MGLYNGGKIMGLPGIAIPAAIKKELSKPITRGYHAWNVWNGVKECPECRSKDILDEICMKCGYKPSLQKYFHSFSHKYEMKEK